MRNRNLNGISNLFSSQMQTPVHIQYTLTQSVHQTDGMEQQQQKKRSVRTAGKPEKAESVILTTNRM